MHASQGHHAVSLDASPTRDGGRRLRRIAHRLDIGFETVEYGAAIEGALSEISERDRAILHLRFAEDLTQSEIAEAGGRLPDARLADLRSTLETLRGAVSEDRTKPPTAGPSRRPRTRRTRRCCRQAPCRSSPQCCRPASSACQSRRGFPSEPGSARPPSTSGPSRVRVPSPSQIATSSRPLAKSSAPWAGTASPSSTVSASRSTENSARV